MAETVTTPSGRGVTCCIQVRRAEDVAYNMIACTETPRLRNVPMPGFKPRGAGSTLRSVQRGLF